jgi:hypothetical protein
MPSRKSKTKALILGIERRAACFWVAACKAFYGTSYVINYWEKLTSWT